MKEKKDFKQLGQFASEFFSLPHSSATCERVFSKINNVKTKSRNRMYSSTLQSLLSASEFISKTGCDKFQPTKKMISYMNANNIYEAKNQRENNLLVTISNSINISQYVEENDNDVCEIIFD